MLWVGATTLNITTFNTTTQSIHGSYVTLSITETQRNNALHYAECRVSCYIMLNVTMLSVVIPNVVAPVSFCADYTIENKDFKQS
jgi:hypothetical protein